MKTILLGSLMLSSLAFAEGPIPCPSGTVPVMGLCADQPQAPITPPTQTPKRSTRR